MELHTMKIRLERGRLNKAQRAELFHDVPVGYIRGDDGLPQFDPDVSAQHVMKMFFELFGTLGSSHALFQHLAAHNIKLPFRTRGGPIEWRLAAKTTVYGLLKVIEDEVTRRTQLETLYAHRVQQAQYATDLAQRRYKEVDPANRLVAASLERDWEAAMSMLQIATHELEELRSTQPVPLSDAQREHLLSACESVTSLWNSRATIEERKQITRLLLHRVDVHVLNNSERVSLRLHWAGGFESCHDIARPVSLFRQLDSYDELIKRTLSLAMLGHSNPEIAIILAEEKFVSPRSLEPVSRHMVQKLLESPQCVKQLRDPELLPNHWRAADLAARVGIPEKRLKDWVTRGWANAVQRPHGRTWVIYADANELHRLQQLAASQTVQGSRLPSENLRTPASIPRQKQ